MAPRYLRRGVQVILAGYLLNLIVFPEDPIWQLGVLQTIGLQHHRARSRAVGHLGRAGVAR